MRQVKFRIWDKEENKFFEPIYEAYKGKLLDLSISLSGRLLRRTLEMPAEDQSNFEDRYEKIEWTGETDKNGVDIYEGYICKCRYYKHAEKDLYLTQKIIFDHASFFVVVGDLTPDLETETYSVCPLSWVNEIEVIGNIYETPELL